MDSPDPVEGLEFARKVGYLTKGVVYCLIGGMTALWAVGLGGEKTDNSAVRNLIEEQPLGRVLLVAVAAGLALYAVYRLSEAYGAFKQLPREKHELFKGIGYTISGLAYFGTAIAFGREALGLFTSEHGSARWLASILEWPGGFLLVAAAGLTLAGVGIFQAYQGITGKYLKLLRVQLVNHGKERWFRKTGMTGYVARAIIFVGLGGLLLFTAYRHNAHEFDGTKGVFDYLEDLPLGAPILGIVALGLLSYGLFMFVIAIYGKKA